MEDIKNTAVTAHEFTLDTILLMGYWLYGKMPEIHLLTVSGTNFETGENITPAVKSRIPEVINMIFSQPLVSIATAFTKDHLQAVRLPANGRLPNGVKEHR